MIGASAIGTVIQPMRSFVGSSARDAAVAKTRSNDATRQILTRIFSLRHCLSGCGEAKSCVAQSEVSLRQRV
jgi:hypothetical protein